MNKQKHFVTFYSPGSFVSETTVREISSWDVSLAVKMSRSVLQRHNATPYGFRFSTEESDGWKPEIVEASSMYYLGGMMVSIEELVAENDPSNTTLISNMKINGYDEVLINNNSWKFTTNLEDGDVVLDY